MSTDFYNLKQEIDSSPSIYKAVSEKAIKEYVDKTGLQLINPTVTAGSSSSPYLAVKWDVSDVAGVTTVSDGMRVLARVNAVGVSTGGLLLSIDGGTTYHPVVYAASTIPTTTYMAVGTTVLLIYNADATATCYGTSGTSTSYTGCWQLDYHFTLYMYRLLHNNGTYVTKTDLKRYKLMVQYDETTMLPISSGSGTSSHTIDTTNAFMPFGQICYCNTSTTNYKSAGAAIGASVLANMYAFDMRYTFNGGTSMLTANKDVYLVANPQSDGKAKIDSTPLTQELPSTEDNKIYIYLGHTYSAYQMELHPVHPIYWYKNGAIREWTNAPSVPTLTDVTATVEGNTYDGTHKVYLPSSDPYSTPRTPSSHTHGNIANDGKITSTTQPNDVTIANGDKLVVVDADDTKVARTSLAFDGSTTSKYLSQKGTWENEHTGTVTSVQVQATSPVQSSQNTAQTGTLNTTISLASGYGDTQNPYGSKTANTVLAAPNGSAGTPSFRALVPADLPDVTVTMSLTRVVATKTYTVSNASHTPAQVNTLMTSGARVVIKAEISGGYFYLYPDLEYSSLLLYFWGAGTDSRIAIMGNLTGAAFDNIPANGWGGGYEFYTHLGSDRAIASGDHLAITSVDAISDIEQSSIVFDTSNTTQYLRADGTWGTPAGSGDTGYAYELLPDNTTNITYNNSKAYLQVGVTGTTQTFNLAVNNTCTNYLLVTNEGSGDCAIAIGVQSGTRYGHVIKPSSGITLASGKAVELSFMSIKSHRILVVTVSAEMEIDTLS